jgi:hypothetical protein
MDRFKELAVLTVSRNTVAPPYISVPGLKHYDGTFSFVTSRLHANITRALPTYDKTDPKTWPYVTLATIDCHAPYQDYPDLPTGVAYERKVMERYEAMYSALERASSVGMNGAFHQRYPFNFDRFEVRHVFGGVSLIHRRHDSCTRRLGADYLRHRK